MFFFIANSCISVYSFRWKNDLKYQTAFLYKWYYTYHYWRIAVIHNVHISFYPRIDPSLNLNTTPFFVSVWSGPWSSHSTSFTSGTSWACHSWRLGRWAHSSLNTTRTLHTTRPKETSVSQPCLCPVLRGICSSPHTQTFAHVVSVWGRITWAVAQRRSCFTTKISPLLWIGCRFK